MEPTTTPEVRCPKCNSNQLYAGKKGFSGKKAVVGAVITGPIGIAAGTLGSNKIKITCLNCGHVFNAGDNAKAQKQKEVERLESAKKSFYLKYECGDKQEGFDALKKADPSKAKYDNADHAYRSLKQFDKVVNIISAVLIIGIVALLIYWLA